MFRKKVFLVRIDKIGDLILTLPTDQNLNPEKCDVVWIIRKGLGIFAGQADPPRHFHEVSDENDYAKLLERERPDIVILFYGPNWLYKKTFRARIPFRGGRKSSLLSFFALNHGVRQRRHLSEQSELAYNFELLKPLQKKYPDLFLVTAASEPLKLKAPDNRNILERFSLRSNDFFIVHPGMAGSALNWASGHYIALVDQLAQDAIVVITGTADDGAWLAPLQKHFSGEPMARVLFLIDQLSLGELLFLLSRARAVIAPSTGVLHLAASLGVRTIGLYSPVLAHSARRWGALGPKAYLFSPLTSMDEITVAQVLQKVRA